MNTFRKVLVNWLSSIVFNEHIYCISVFAAILLIIQYRLYVVVYDGEHGLSKRPLSLILGNIRCQKKWRDSRNVGQTSEILLKYLRAERPIAWLAGQPCPTFESLGSNQFRLLYFFMLKKYISKTDWKRALTSYWDVLCK